MKVLFILLFTFLGLGVPTIEQNTFDEVVHDNYDYYQVVMEEETTVGDVKIVWGSVNKKMYFSVFFYQTHANMHKIEINGKIIQDKVISIHKVRLKEDTKIKILSENGAFFKEYIVENIEYEDFITVAYTGNGENDFPKEKMDFDIFDIFLYMFYGFIILVGILSFILLMLYRNRVGKFNQETQIVENYIEADYDYQTEEIEDKSEEELMKEAYEDYHKGKITEQELNNRLRNIWWSNKDD